MMSSIIEGYKYDIFISYRQKDNKGDRWVSEFVDSLKTELESTFKEEISVYFDINPHDGLLETHDVDASLKEKLKCLVFIPIISRTYCDPKSFAWEHEFKVFVEQASNDQFGLKLKLPGGNVASRVLPVRIHDLEMADIKECESLLGGFLRGIEFIYKEPGVNRPLTTKDNEEKNLSRTNYRNQINKVALAIREIFTSITLYSPQHEEVEKDAFRPALVPQKNHKTKIIAGLIIAFALVVLGFLFIPKLLKSEERIEKSIAVLPFKLLSDESDKQYLADGMMDAILMHLQKFRDIKVLSRTSVEQYRGTTKSVWEISHELDVGFLLEGSFQKHGDNVKLIVQLIKSNEDRHAWANEYNIAWKDVFMVQSDVAKAIAGELHTTISPEELVLVDKIPTSDLNAYDLYMKAQDYKNDFEKTRNVSSYNKALSLYRAALEIDSAYAKVYTGLAAIYYYRYYWETYFKESFLDTCLTLVNKALSLDDKQEEAYYIKGNYYGEKGDTASAIYNFNEALKINPNYYLAYRAKGYGLTTIQHNYVGGIDNYTKALSLIRGDERPLLLRLLGRVYLDVGFTEKALNLYKEAYSIDGKKASYYGATSWIEFSNENFEEAVNLSNLAKEIDTTYLTDLILYLIPAGHEKDAYIHAKQLINKSERTGSLPIYQSHRIGYALIRAGKTKEGQSYLNQQIRYSQENIKLSRTFAQRRAAHYDLAATYAYLGEKEKAYQYLEEFGKLNFYQKWWISMAKNDPFFVTIRKEAQFQKLLQNMQAKHQAEHERVRKWLEEQGML